MGPRPGEDLGLTGTCLVPAALAVCRERPARQAPSPHLHQANLSLPEAEFSTFFFFFF